MLTDDDSDQSAGLRERVGELCHRSGVLRVLQGVRAWVRRDVRILAYHRVLTLADGHEFDFDLDLVSASAEDFRAQMRLLKQRFRPMRLGDVVAAMAEGRPLPADAVVVTFDDGYDDNYREAYPILCESGVPATFFVSTGYIDSGRPYDYDWVVHMILGAQLERVVMPALGLDVPMPASRIARRRLAGRVLSGIKALDGPAQTSLMTELETDWGMSRGGLHPDCRPMSWEQLREMHAAGFEIGSHGVHHRMLAKLSQAELEFELGASKATLERELGAPATLISYPVGGRTAFDDRVIRAAGAAGYDAGCSYICGTNPVATARRYGLYRLPVERTMGLGWFAAMLTLPEYMSYPTSNHVTDSVRDACSP
ncbi:MAG: polysaccharide deacetylase family protein [Rhodanobacter sp.]|nr:polysaccharide deacetylase family protein [Rhodanobacter sp.]